MPNIDSSKELIIRFMEDFPSLKRLILLIFNEDFLSNSDNCFLENFILYLFGMPVITSTWWLLSEKFFEIWKSINEQDDLSGRKNLLINKIFFFLYKFEFFKVN